MAEIASIPTSIFENRLEDDPLDFESDVQNLGKSYEMIAPDRVKNYLRGHRALPGLLHEAASSLTQAFGADTTFQLDLSSGGEDVPVLRVLALWPGSAAAGNAALRVFDDNFWIANCDRASGYLVIDRELV